MLMARAFNRLGALHTHFVPFQNNLPVGHDPDVYLHWPPLYPLLLALFLRVAGNTVFAARLLQLLITLCSGALVALIGRRLYSARIGWLGAFFFFTSRAVYVGAAPLIQQPLAMLFALLSVYCFLRAIPLASEASEASEAPAAAPLFAALGACATACMIFSAWDPVFIPFGLLATALWIRHRRAARLAAIYCLCAVAAFLAVELDYILSYPKLFANQFATIAYRAGLHFKADTSLRLPTFVDAAVFDQQFGILDGFWHALRFAVQFLSPIAIAAAVLYVALWLGNGGARRHPHRAEPADWVIGGLLLPALVWYAVMRNYVAIHPFPMILFAPVVALASGFFLDRLWISFNADPRDTPPRFAAAFLIPLVLLLPLFIDFRDARQTPPPEFAGLSRLIRSATPPTAVVLTPEDSLIPTLYSDRHLVRGIENEKWLASAIAQAHAGFPAAPLYLALRQKDAADFPHTLPALSPPTHLGDSVLYTLR